MSIFLQTIARYRNLVTRLDHGSFMFKIEGERALRFTDREEQNMKIIPRNMVSGITIRRLVLMCSTSQEFEPWMVLLWQ